MDFCEEMLVWFRSNGRMLDFRDSGQEIEHYGLDKDLNKEMLWFCSTGRMLDFRDPGKDIDKTMVLMRISKTKCC